MGRWLGVWASTFLLLPGNSLLKHTVAAWAPVSLFHLRELSHRWKVSSKTLLCRGSLDGSPEPNLVQRQIQQPHDFCLMGLCPRADPNPLAPTLWLAWWTTEMGLLMDGALGIQAYWHRGLCQGHGESG